MFPDIDLDIGVEQTPETPSLLTRLVSAPSERRFCYICQDAKAAADSKIQGEGYTIPVHSYCLNRVGMVKPDHTG